MKENDSAGLKYVLFIGIPVIIILGILGAYYQMTNPISVITRTIHTSYDYLDSLFSSKVSSYSAKDPMRMKFDFSFQTDSSDALLLNMQKYHYNLELAFDYNKEFAQVAYGMKEGEDDILRATFYQFQNKQYLQSDQLFSQILNITSDTLINFKEEFLFDEFETQGSMEEMKDILKHIKNIFVSSLDKKYVNREKVDISIYQDTVKATKISYLFNEENQKRTLNHIVTEIEKDSSLVQKLTSYFDCTNDQLYKELENLKRQASFNDFQLIIYTEGLTQNVIRISIEEENEEQISFTNYKDFHTLLIPNVLYLKIKDMNEKLIDLEYEILSQKLKGNILFLNRQSKNENEFFGDLDISVVKEDFEGQFHFRFEFALDEYFSIPDFSNALSIDEMNNEEVQTFLENLEQSLQGTFLYDLFSQNIM